MQHLIIKKKQIDALISLLIKDCKVAAPVDRGFDNYSFEFVTSGKNVVLEKYIPTILPPKKYFLPQYETLLTYDTSKGQNMMPVVESQKLVLLGVHTCDLAGIMALDDVFANGPTDVNFEARKKDITVIGLECLEYCDKYASCKLVETHLPNGGYDLFFTDIGDCFIVHVLTKKGEVLVLNTKLFEKAESKHLKALEKVRENKKQIFRNEISLKYDELAPLFGKSFDSPVWTELDSRCVACGNCTAVCPTCYCFDVIDEPNLDLTSGRRFRRWDSCQNEPFAKVSSGENFRKLRGMRQKHRYFRKFKYQFDKYSKYHCTGCGRCSRTCMACINLKETLTELAKTQNG